MEKITAKINGIEVTVDAGTSILDAARQVQMNIPTLCYHNDLDPTAACGICIVKDAKAPRKMLRSCCTALANGMEILTHDPEIVEVRKTVVELMLSNHPDDCLQCGRSGNCELQKISADFGIRTAPYEKIISTLPPDDSTGSIILDPAKCIKCGRCVEVCQNIQNVWALNFIGRGIEEKIAPAGDILMKDSPCVRCGQCSAHCPTGAILEFDDTKKVWDILKDKNLNPVVQIAPAVRVAIGEAFGYEPGEITTGKLYAALRRLGFTAIFDTNFSADLTILEEGTEFVKRFTTGGTLPLITSCCPGWVDYMEKYHDDMMDNFSTCKSPQQMLGAMAKTYYAEQAKLDVDKMRVISIMPCTAKKHEIMRDDNMSASGHQDVDVVLTTRELANMLKQSGIDFRSLKDEEADSILGSYTGAGTIFGATGGVMEAAIRSAYYLVTKEELQNVNVMAVRGLEGIKEGEIDIKGTKVRVAVAHGLKNVQDLLAKVRDAKAAGKEVPWHFIEVMACPGGCIAGGGQPYGVTNVIRKMRTEGMYKDDVKQTLRCSHHNPEITKIYKEFLGEPCGHKSHELLHTHYTKRDVYQQ